MSDLQKLLSLLEISEDDAVRALLTSFAAVQPGPKRQAMVRRFGEEIPSTAQFWEIMVRDDFACTQCGARYGVEIRPKKEAPIGKDPARWELTCRDCSREDNHSLGLVNDKANLRIFRSFLQLTERLGRAPSGAEVQRHAGLTTLSGGNYTVKLFAARLERSARKKDK